MSPYYWRRLQLFICLGLSLRRDLNFYSASVLQLVESRDINSSILFTGKAYSLTREGENYFGKEAIDILVKYVGI